LTRVTRGSHTPLFNHSEPGQRSTHHGEANGILTVHPRGLPNRGLTNGPVTEFHGLKLYPFQSQAVEALEKDHSVIVAAPTGAGKTIVAEFAIEKALQEGVRVAYTSPVKALSNQKFRNFREIYPGKVGIMTGDVTIDADAPILIMTTEVFRNTLFEDESRLRGIRYVVFDEVHFLDDPERGTVWEESIIFAPPDVRFVFLSATISNLREFSAWIQKVRPDTHLEVVHSDERPVPLRHFLFFPEYGVVSLKKMGQVFRNAQKSRSRKKKDPVDVMIELDRLPVLYFSFSRKDCEHLASRYRHLDLLRPEEADRLSALFDEFAERYEVNGLWKLEELGRLVKRGVAFHHAGMLPTFKEIVERLFTTGLIKLLFTTETFALGVNMPARTVLFDRLRKFNGIGFEPMRTLSYYQMAGRAGRQGIDTEGFVYCRINTRWDTEETVRRTVLGKVDPIRSRFNLSYSTILNLWSRMGERIFDAAERSFFAFQRSRKAWKRVVGQLSSKLDLLREGGYIKDLELTAKGAFAAKINGYEIQVSEFMFRDWFYSLDEERLFLLILAVVYEARRGAEAIPPRRGVIKEVRRESLRIVAEFQAREKELGIRGGTKSPDFGLSRAGQAWFEGCEFDDLLRYTDVPDGDLVRNFRLAIQLMRQVAKALETSLDLRDRVLSIMRQINRDEVDAERQLRLG